MTFTPGEPQNAESLGSSKPKIRNNLDGLRASLAINHVDINDPNNGKHKFLQMPEQASDPATGTNIGGLYTAQSLAGATNFTNLFWKQETGGANQLLNQGGFTALTGPLPTIVGTGGWSYLPGGLLINFGTVPAAADGASFIWPSNFAPYTIPFTSILSVSANLIGFTPAIPGSAFFCAMSTVSVTGYTIRLLQLSGAPIAGAADFCFIAIGQY